MNVDSSTKDLPTLTEPLRIGLVGGGKMGLHHARAIARLGSLARVVAVADPSAEAGAAAIRVIPGAQAFTSLGEMLREMRLDVVHICTSPQTHERLAAEALEHGCHIYVEKPFVETTRAADRLINLARARGLRICAGHQLLFEPPTRMAVDYLPALGQLVHIESYFSFRTVRRMANGRTPLSADLQLLDILPHPVYLLLHFLAAAAPDERPEISAIEVGPGGTVHALVRCGAVTATLVVTLDGRPVESYVKLVGTNGTVTADYVRGTVQRQIGPGTSGIDKALNPFRLARQLLTGTTAALTGRIVRKQRSYPGLAEIMEAFYGSIRSGATSPTPPSSLVETVRICESVAVRLKGPAKAPPNVFASSGAIASGSDSPAAPVLVTGGTGFLGREVVQAFRARGIPVRVLSRRLPPAWEQLPGVEFVVADLGSPLPPEVMADVETVVHCAAETAGGWAEHQRNSIDAVQNLVNAAAAAAVQRIIHVSSLAVIASEGGRAADESTPLFGSPKECGPYVWGKLESERLMLRLAAEAGIEAKVARPGALVDYRRFDPPGRLGRRLGNVFVAVGSSGDALGVVDVGFAARAIAWMAVCFDEAPEMINLLAPELPTRRELLARLRKANPDLTVVWLPRAVLVPLSWAAIGLQKVLRPGRPAMNVAQAFAVQPFNTSLVSSIAPRVSEWIARPRTVERETVAT